MIRAVLYARVSTASQGEPDKASIPEQTAQIQKYCAEKGYIISDQYIDIGYSGATKRRPRFQAMLADAREGKFDVIVCWKSDRLSRGMFAASELMETIEPLGIRLEAVMEPIDLNTFAMYALVGKFELDNIRTRTKMGREARVRTKGLFPGGDLLPYGYKYQDGKIELEESEAKWIKHLFEWIISGKSLGSWVKYANENGFKQRRGTNGIVISNVSHWLKNPIYRGEFVWRKSTMIPGQAGKKRRKWLTPDNYITIPCPAVVIPEVWAAVQERLKQNSKFSSGNAKHFYLLRNLMTCEFCGKSFMAITQLGIRHYECTGTRVYPHKYHCRVPKRINADRLERYIWNELVEKLDNVVSENNAIDYLLNNLEKSKSDLQERLTREKEKLDNIPMQRQRIATLIRKCDISEKESDLQFRAIKAEEEQYQAEITKIESMLNNNGMGQLRELIDRVRILHREYNFGGFSDVPDDVKRKILKEIVDTITIGHTVEIRLKLQTDKLMDALVNDLCYDKIVYNDKR